MKKEKKLTKRLFVGIFLPTEWQEKFEKYKKAFPEVKGMRWTPKDNMHITVLFIGQIPETKLPQVKNTIAKIAKKHRPFEMKFDQFRQAPPFSEQPSMLWGQFKLTGDFELLVQDLKRAIMSVTVLEEESKRVIPHVTLARKKDMPVMEKVDVNVKDRTMPVTSIALVESSIFKGASKYKIIEKYDLEKE